jgi:hypothetical protein
MFGRTAIFLALVAGLLTLSLSGVATADDGRGYPFCQWAGPLHFRSYYNGYYGYYSGYTLESVPYFVANPPVYYGYSMLVPRGPGFTTVNYGDPAASQAQHVEPLMVINPYYKKGGADAPVSPKPAAPKATGTQPLTIPNPYVLR